jgi:hypothetical protein
VTDWVGFLSDPSFGIPVLLLGGLLAVWWGLNPHDYPMMVRRPTDRPVPDRDPVSRAILAFDRGRFSEVLEMATTRLDRVSTKRFGVRAARLPWTPWGLWRLEPARRSEARALRRLNARIERLEATSLRRESGVWLRLDFWRSRDELLARFRRRLTPLLNDVSTLAARAPGATP